MCIELDIPDPLVNITDRDTGLIGAHYEIYPHIDHLLCVWHINKDIVANCKGKFDTKEDWDDFYAAWNLVVYAHTRAEFELAWESLQNIYDPIDGSLCGYLAKTWVNRYKKSSSGHIRTRSSTSLISSPRRLRVDMLHSRGS